LGELLRNLRGIEGKEPRYNKNVLGGFGTGRYGGENRKLTGADGGGRFVSG